MAFWINISSTGAGTKVIKFQLNADGWADPSTVQIMFDLQNTNTNATAAKLLRTLQPPGSFFRRLRVGAGGALIEDFDYIRTHHMLEIMASAQNRERRY